VTNGEAEYIDYLVGMRPDQMRTENPPALGFDERQRVLLVQPLRSAVLTVVPHVANGVEYHLGVMQ
jgi:hypothetical protein